jgi:hypothetical protein
MVDEHLKSKIFRIALFRRESSRCPDVRPAHNKRGIRSQRQDRATPAREPLLGPGLVAEPAA